LKLSRTKGRAGQVRIALLEGGKGSMRLKRFFHNLKHPGSESDRERRARLLNLLVGGFAAVSFVFLIVLLIFFPPRRVASLLDYRGLYLGVISMLVTGGIVYLLNRRGHVDLAAILFLTLLVGMISVSDTAVNVIDGRSLIFYTIPILAAGLLIRAWAGFVFAGLSSLAILGLSVYSHAAFPNYPAIIIFFVLALISWMLERSRDLAIRSARDSASKFLSLYETMTELMAIHELVWDAAGQPVDYRVLDCNPAYSRLTGIPRDRAVGTLASLLYGTGKPPYLEEFAAVARTGTPASFDAYFPQLGKHFQISAFSAQPGGFAILADDISERKHGEERLRAALEEKGALLREVHHRVKNNLQAIIYLTDMQASQVRDRKTKQFLKELEGQARTMSLVYEQLYQSENLSRVTMTNYLQKLVTNVLEALGVSRRFELHLQVEPLSLDVAQAMPCGLIVNELVTNSVKYAFPSGFAGEPAIQIGLRADGDAFVLTVGDNGVGIPAGYDMGSSTSLGLRLVQLWATHQLGGTLDRLDGPGTVYQIRFGVG
jgi:two-component sensor histidine kinase/PAS domain-containing protein